MVSLKIFQIGFNKSGTASIYYYFKNEGFKSIHWEKGKLSKTIKNNFDSGLPILKGYEDYQVFTDMEHREADQTAVYSAENHFKEFDKQYPGSIFILNYRDIDKWVDSRKNHPAYLKRTMLSTSLTEDAVVKLWKENYQRHINAVKEYFKERDNLIVIDLDHDDNQKLYRELSVRGIELKSKELPHTHKTKVNLENKKDRQQHINAIRNAALFFEKEDLEVARMLMKIANKLRPEGSFIKKKLNELEIKSTSLINFLKNKIRN